MNEPSTREPNKAQGFSLRWAVETVLKTFRADEAAGYRSKDRQYAISMLGKAIEMNPVPTSQVGMREALEKIVKMYSDTYYGYYAVNIARAALQSADQQTEELERLRDINTTLFCLWKTALQREENQRQRAVKAECALRDAKHRLELFERREE